MGIYMDIRNVVLEVLDDYDWHTVDEFQKKCDESGVELDGKKHRIYNIVHELKNGGKIESSGKGKYRMLSEVIENKEQNEEINDDSNDYDHQFIKSSDLKQAISYIEKALIIYKNFNLVNCPEKELKKVLSDVRGIRELYEKIQVELKFKV